MFDLRIARLSALALAAAPSIVGCSDSSKTSSPRTSTTTPTPTAPSTATTTTTLFTGTVDGFYEVPTPLPPGEPGELIRVQPVANDATSVTVRIMYHSTDAQGRDRAVTGQIRYPTTTPPAGGWPVLSWAHGTSGLASHCAPSRRGSPSFGIDGITVASDYIGLGPVGERHPFLSGLSEGHSVIDAVRAARNIDAAHAGTRWLAVGISQGGHAALFTNELAESYAPSLDLLGTVALAPGSELDHLYGPTDALLFRVISVMGLYGLATDYPEVRPEDYVSAETAALERVLDDGCVGEIGTEYLKVPTEVFYDHDPITTEPAASVLARNEPGHSKSESPLLVVQGTADVVVLPARTDALMKQLCSIGQVVQFVSVPGADHNSVIDDGADVVTTWLGERLAGRPPVDSCPSS